MTESLDAGPVIARSEVPVLPGDDAESLGRRVLEAEHRLYPACLAQAAAIVAAGAKR